MPIFNAATSFREHSDHVSRERGFLFRVSLFFGTAIAIALLILNCSPNFDSSAERTAPLGSDFLQEWTGGNIWLSNQRSRLYDTAHFQQVQHDPALTGFTWSADKSYPMVYPPFYYMLVSPLSTIPYRYASYIWVLTLGLVAGATLMCFTAFFEPARRHWGKCILALFAFYPLLLSLNMAQKSIVLLLILCLTYVLLYHRRRFAAGAIFGLIAFKPHLGILIGLVMLLKGQWRFVAGCATTVAVLIGLSFVAGPELCRDYFWQCLAMSDYSQTSGYQLSDAHHLAGAIGLMTGENWLSGRIVWVALTFFVIAMTVFAFRGPIDFQSRSFALQFSFLVIATILLSPHFYTYDLTIVLLPIALIVFSLLPAASKSWSPDQISIKDKYRKSLFLLCALLFVGTGLAAGFAENFHIQPTTVVLLAMLFCLAKLQVDHQKSTDREAILLPLTARFSTTNE